ncbi:hypothetical protein I7I53_10588 [Histoplasma capsulatum var. duboisii H88]|uniref:Uncharacterized protein n=1 Tax=Ajellomyces capsulatus (strain H88) TaxID=544711 RepID=A0A8A1LE10_AJEC8|nr:hypothetical protein I7I53_10588 [Histoplasma capsulatum var. duboisii H88]
MFTGFTYLLTAEYRNIPSISGLIVDYLTCCSYDLMVCQFSDLSYSPRKWSPSIEQAPGTLERSQTLGVHHNFLVIAPKIMIWESKHAMMVDFELSGLGNERRRLFSSQENARWDRVKLNSS